MVVLPPCVATQVCIYLEDLRPLSCAACGRVALDDGRRQAERHLPGTTKYLPGNPKSQVQTLLGKRALRRIDPMDTGASPQGCIALLELRQSGGLLWRSVSQVSLRDVDVDSSIVHSAI